MGCHLLTTCHQAAPRAHIYTQPSDLPSGAHVGVQYMQWLLFLPRMLAVGLLFKFTKSNWQTVRDRKKSRLPYVLAICQITRFDK